MPRPLRMEWVVNVILCSKTTLIFLTLPLPAGPMTSCAYAGMV